MRPRGPLSAGRLAVCSLALAGLLAAAILLAASLGAAEVSLWDLLSADPAASDGDRVILLKVRLPRVLLAALLGGALTTAGTTEEDGR